jgi:hypothetical protein
MVKVIQGANEFKAITSKEYVPPIIDLPKYREEFKEYLYKTFSRFPDVISTFEEFQFDIYFLEDISKLGIDDAQWDDYGIKTRL